MALDRIENFAEETRWNLPSFSWQWYRQGEKEKWLEFFGKPMCVASCVLLEMWYQECGINAR